MNKIVASIQTRMPNTAKILGAKGPFGPPGWRPTATMLNNLAGPVIQIIDHEGYLFIWPVDPKAIPTAAD